MKAGDLQAPSSSFQVQSFPVALGTFSSDVLFPFILGTLWGFSEALVAV